MMFNTIVSYPSPALACVPILTPSIDQHRRARIYQGLSAFISCEVFLTVASVHTSDRLRELRERPCHIYDHAVYAWKRRVQL